MKVLGNVDLVSLVRASGLVEVLPVQEILVHHSAFLQFAAIWHITAYELLTVWTSTWEQANSSRSRRTLVFPSIPNSVSETKFTLFNWWTLLSFLYGFDADHRAYSWPFLMMEESDVIPGLAERCGFSRWIDYGCRPAFWQGCRLPLKWTEVLFHHHHTHFIVAFL